MPRRVRRRSVTADMHPSIRHRPRLLTLIALSSILLALAAPAHAAAPTQQWARPDLGYPRLADYNGLRASWQAPFLASDDIVVAHRGAPISALTAANPDALTLLYERTLQVDLRNMFDLYATHAQSLPPSWWLLLAGSRLSAAVSDTQSAVAVVDPRPFARCQDVLVDGESMHVVAVRGNVLTVQRGYYSLPAYHNAGALIAPHYSYRTDLSNCTRYALRPWSLNLSSLCPRVDGQTWADFMAAHVAYVATSERWRGLFVDNLTDLPTNPLVDVSGDGQADGGVVGGVNVWRAGERALLASLRRLLPGAPIVVNGDLQIDGLADGREYEGFPLIPGGALTAAIDAYLYDSDSGRPLTIVNADTVDRPHPSPMAARLTTGVALLGNGEAAYDHGWQQHGYPWWFDVYGGGAGSATTRAVDARADLLPVVHPQRFNLADVVLVDQEAARVLRVLPGGLLVQRGVMGTAAMSHVVDTAVTTAAQRAASRGFMGRPLGPARLVQTVATAHLAMPAPVALGGDMAMAGGRTGMVVKPLPARPLALFSTGYYDPYAVRLTMTVSPGGYAQRALSFEARGPAGESVWLSSGHLAVQLLLRDDWHRYVLPIGGAATIRLGIGRVRGHVLLRGITLFAAQAFVWRRDFTRGSVVVNSTDAVQTVDLGGLYRTLDGDQSLRPDGGRLVRTFTLPPRSASFLTPVG